MAHPGRDGSFTRRSRPDASLPLDAVGCRAGGLAFLQYTGGTTGVAKGAMLTHGNVSTNVLQAEAWLADKLLATRPAC